MIDRFPDVFVHPTTGERFRIKDRVPYRLVGEKTTAANTQNSNFDNASFSHNLAEPFEIHGVKCHITTLDNSSNPQADPSVLVEPWVAINIKPISGARSVMSAAERATTLFDYPVARYGRWDWEVPWTILSNQGFRVTVDNYMLSAAAAGGVRTELTMFGYILILGDKIG